MLYYLDMWLAPLLAATIIGEATASGASWEWFGWCIFGVILFSFVEYWVHRSLLHRWFYHGQHERHHTHPEEKVIFPWWYTPAIFAGFFVVLPLHVFAGFVLGYCWFLYWHHALHFWRLDRHPWVRAYASWHNLHHAGLPVNYGITTPMWDFIFRTYQTAR